MAGTFMSVKETVHLCGENGRVVGVLTEPAARRASSARGALVLTNSPQLHRTGPNRMHVEIARRLAALGVATFRFDFTGIGDSQDSAYSHSLPVLRRERWAAQDTRDVLNYLNRSFGLKRFVLAGNCAGGYMALRVACDDERVCAVVGFNMPVDHFSHDAAVIGELETQRRSDQLGRGSLLDPTRWQRFLSGQTSPKRILQVVAAHWRRAGHLETREREGAPSRVGDELGILDRLALLYGRKTRMCLTFGQNELGHRYMLQVIGEQRLAEFAPELEMYVLPDVDHQYIQHRSRWRFITDLNAWMVAALAEEPGAGRMPRFRDAENILGPDNEGVATS